LGIDDRGDAEAISLALETKADLLLADDKKARRAAKQRGLVTTGAVGVLELAAKHGLLELSAAFAGLRATNFGISQSILDAALARDGDRKRTP
jgi:predicted nucleic acid-binding protein